MTGESVASAFRVPVGQPVDLASHDPRAKPVGPQKKSVGRADLAALGVQLDGLQEALWAQSRGHGDSRRVLVVLQGMDTAGKGGVVRAVGGLLNPQGVQVTTFGKPTEEELQHDFLWRVRQALPPRGVVGFFDRSHYEDVLVARVDQLSDDAEIERRVQAIAEFEQQLHDDGVRLLKVYLHISADKQLERLLARLDNPDKHWKYSPADRTARATWGDYHRAYADVLQRCASDAAPWYLVPADRKWYRNWVVGSLLVQTLQQINPQLPQPTYDVVAERAALLAEDPLS